MFARGRPQVSPTDTHINIGRGLVFSADLCYNGANKKPPLRTREVAFSQENDGGGLLLTSLSSFCSLRSISQSLSLAFARQLPLHKEAFDTIKFLFAFSSSAEPLLNHAIVAWFSSYKKKRKPLKVRLPFVFNLGFCPY